MGLAREAATLCPTARSLRYSNQGGLWRTPRAAAGPADPAHASANRDPPRSIPSRGIGAADDAGDACRRWWPAVRRASDVLGELLEVAREVDQQVGGAGTVGLDPDGAQRVA